MHTNILAVLYFVFGYASGFVMIVTDTELHVKLLGAYLLILYELYLERTTIK